MFLDTFSLDGWRNYTKAGLQFSPNVNFLIGDNGQGKTNLLEAVYFVCTGQAPRASRLHELINWSGKYFFLRGMLRDSERDICIESGLARDGRRVHKVDGVNMEKIAQLGETVTAVFFMPQDVDLVREGPGVRRRFLDIEIGQLSRQYKHTLSRYAEVLKERNSLLRFRCKDEILLNVLTEKLVELYPPIAAQRQQFLSRLNSLTRLRHRTLSNNKENLEIIYKPSLAPELSKEQALAEFESLRKSELQYKKTLLGPHRDDFVIMINGVELRSYGSQGQQRTAVLAIKLAEIELFRGQTGSYPLLLLDDVFSELDNSRKDLLLSYIQSKTQTFITSAEPIDAYKAARVFVVTNGNIQMKDD
ncbi:MAG: DNA replication/repair protein RecF [Firmicutes bacterium]|nr:DNA replication/repair protein RecF [Bacillota bacterium]